MKEDQDKPADAAAPSINSGQALRRLAEERLKAREQTPQSAIRNSQSAQRLVHELSIHQIELEMQNEELQQARNTADALLAQYTDLYDFAPTGYLTLDREGTIRQVNLTGARLLDVERSRLAQRRFSQFVAESDRRAFADFLAKVFASQARESCEVTLLREGAPPLVVRIEGRRSEDGQECRAVVLDITERRHAEQQARAAQAETKRLLALSDQSRRTLLSAAEDQREATALLRMSEERYRTILQTAMDGIWLVDMQGRLLEVNDAYCRMSGYNAQELLAMRISDLEADQTAEQIAASIQKVKTSGEARFETRHRRKDGSLVDVALGIQYRPADGGQFVVFLHDITDHKRAESELLASKALTDAIVENMPLMVFLKEATDLRFVVVNRAGEELLGYDRKALLGKNNLDLFPPEQAANFMAKDREALKGQGVVDIPEESIFTAKKGERLLHTRKVCIRGSDGETRFLLGISEDITDHRRAEREIENEQALSNAIIEGIPGTFYMLDENGKYVRWSAYQRDEIVGKPDAEVAQTLALDTIHPDDRALILSKIENVLKNDVQEAVEGRVLLRGGPAFVWLLMTGRRIILNGRPFLVGIGINITERKHAEAEHAKLQMQFAQAQKMESVGRLAGGVAHDFNNLLMGMMGYVQLCLDKIAPDHPIREYLDEITHGAERSAEITRQLLAFARKQTIAPRVMDLNEAVDSMLKLLRRLIGEDIHLVWRPGMALRPVKIDPSQIDQILANLCVNARDAIDGVGEITLETGSNTIDAEYCARHKEAIPGSYVFLAVSDDGCGMDKETLAQVFEPFFTTKGLGKGTGLGLATVYGIVKQNNGFIYAYSEPGKGTTFKIYLPEIAAETVATTVTPKAEAPRGRGETILLVEDEKSLRVTCGAFLDALGYKVILAETPGEALKMVAGHPGDIHVLLTDVVMPGMDGRQLAKRINAVKPSVKVVFMSGYTSDVIAQRGVLDEGVQFLSKPFTRDDLARKMREILEC